MFGRETNSSLQNTEDLTKTNSNTDHNKNINTKKRQTIEPKIKSLNELTILGHVPHAKHVKTAKKKQKIGTADESTLYYVKSEGQSLAYAQIQAYSSAVCRLLTTNLNTSPVSVYQDEADNLNYYCVSRETKNFKPLTQDQLEKTDLEYSFQNFNIQRTQNIIRNSLADLLSLLNKKNNSQPLKMSAIASSIHSLFTGKFQAGSLQTALAEFAKKPDLFSTEILDQLHSLLSSHILRINDDACEKQLKKICKNIDYLKECEMASSENLLSIPDLEEIDRLLDQDRLESEDLIELTVFGKSIKVNSKDIINYRIIKNLAINLTTAYIFKQGDLHKDNLGKFAFVDYGRIKDNIIFPFTKSFFLDTFIRKPNENTYRCVAEDIDSFPNIKKGNFYHWPTQKTYIVLKLLNVLSDYFQSYESFAKLKENEIYHKLLVSLNKVFNVTQNTLQAEANFILKLAILLQKFMVKIQSFFTWESENNILQEKLNFLLFQITKQQFDVFKSEFSDLIVQVEASCHDLSVFKKHFYTSHDNEVFKSLADDPFFIYHKYKTFLKYTFTNQQIYTCLATLKVGSEHVVFDDKNNTISLHERLIEDEVSRMIEVAENMSQLNNFKLFLAEYGDFAVQSIKAEFLQMKVYYQSKIPLKPEYQALVDAIDIDLMDEVYKTWCDELNVKESILPSVSKIDSIKPSL